MNRMEKGKSKGWIGRISMLMLTLLMGVAPCLFTGQPVWAVGHLNATSPDVINVVQGDTSVTAKVNIDNKNGGQDGSYYGVLKSDYGISAPQSDTVVLGSGTSATSTLVFFLSASQTANIGSHQLSVQIYKAGDSSNVVDTATIQVNVNEKTSAPTGSGGLYASFNVDYTLSRPDGILAGETNDITFTVFNRGNTLLKNAILSIKLPDSMSMVTGSNSENVGYMMIGDTKTVTFHVTADKNAEEKSYPVEFTITGSDMGDAAQTISQTFYMPITGADKANYSMKDIEITGIKAPQQALAGADFTLNFSVSNRGSADAKDLKITVTPPDGLVNRTKNVFVESMIPKGSSKDYSVTLFSQKTAEEKNYPIKITVEPVEVKKDEAVTVVTQYAGVLVKADDGGSVKTPQLMVETYHYGGTYVQAGSNFNLELGLFNTSEKDLRNIKVTMTSTDGIFVPIGSSNSFFIDTIPKKGRITHTMALNCKQSAEQKTTSVEIEMSYEDNKGDAFTSKDTISIPVMQETRLAVDDVVASPSASVGEPAALSVQFYNMGKTTLSNVRVNAEGDFDTTESNSYFAGNMDPGKSDSFDFAIVPKQAGPLNGKVIFKYEDAAGKQQTLEKTFLVQIADAADMSNMPMPDQPEKPGHKIPWKPIGIVAGVCVVLIVALVIWRKHRKKKRERELEIDD